jgi:hypothetical protein
MGRSQGAIRRLEALLMRWSFRDADQNAQNDSASRPDAASSHWKFGCSGRAHCQRREQPTRFSPSLCSSFKF